MTDLDLIKERINIVDLIQEYLPLKKTGINFKANCPFHQERTPSFVVSPERGIWHCFGCSRGGDIFKFLMEKEGLDFQEALEILAQKAGVDLKKSSNRPGKDKSSRLLEAHEKAAQFFHYILLEHPLGKKPLDYLLKRGLTLETIKLFRIGYSPNSWEATTKFLKKRGFTEKELMDSGLSVPSRRGGYDRFRGRVMFPLSNVLNKVIGFSGRVLDNSTPKYINTPQTPIFDKGRFLFGLDLSKGEIRQKKEVILTEGEMDMIMSFQSGIKNVVASKGTALTQNQIELLKKYTNVIKLCFDTDLAGDEASRRGIEMAEASGLSILVVKLEGGKDPGEVAYKDPESWKKAVEEATPIYDYYLESAQKRFDLSTPFGKKEAFKELLPIWRKITNPVTRDEYIEKLSAMLMVKEEMVRKELSKPAPQMFKLKVSEQIPVKENPKTVIDGGGVDRRKLLEEYLIALILHLPVSQTFIPTFPETLFTQESLRQIYVMLVLFLDSISFSGKAFNISEFVKTLPEELVSLVDRLYLEPLDEKLTEPKHWQKEIDNVTLELKRMLIKSSLEKLSLEIKNAQTFAKMETLEILNKRFRDLSVKLKNL